MIFIRNIHFNNFKILSLLFEDYDFVQEKIELIQEIFSFSRAIRVHYYEDINDMQKSIPVKLPRWIKGVSCSDTIYLLSPDRWGNGYERVDSIAQIFVHEYTHTAVFNTFWYPCPLWLNEGLAQNIAEQFKREKGEGFHSGFSYYSEDYSNEDFYDQSAFMVYLLIQNYGLNNLIQYVSKCKDFEDDIVVGKENLQRIGEKFLGAQNESIM